MEYAQEIGAPVAFPEISESSESAGGLVDLSDIPEQPKASDSLEGQTGLPK